MEKSRASVENPIKGKTDSFGNSLNERQPFVAGKFYSFYKESLIKEIEGCFESRLGPGPILPEAIKKRDIIAAIAPHAGYFFSGPCAAHCYKAIAESGHYDLFVIFGFSHSYHQAKPIAASMKSWKTPLGRANIDIESLNRILGNCGFAYVDELIHSYEHSIELQLPFLQYCLGKIAFIPFSVSASISLYEIKSYAKKLAKELKALNKRICFIASSDFIHYGSSYGYMPFKGNNKEEEIKKADELNKKAIAYITDKDSKSFSRLLAETKATICGSNAILMLLETIKAYNKNTGKGELLCYYKSSDILENSMEEINDFVCYASIIFECSKN